MPEDLPLTKIVATCIGDAAKLEAACAEYPEHADTLRRACSLVDELTGIAAAAGTLGNDNAGLFADRYRLEHRLGIGGMGAVYRAADTKMDRPVALKQVRLDLADLQEVRARFAREIRAASRIEHPNLCRVYDGDVWEDVPYMVMELLDGETLHQRIQGGTATRQELLGHVEKIARALHAVHEADMLHRDVKPANIMVRRDGEPVLLDFGLARDLRGDGGLTRAGSEPGTWSYMSPEQLAPVRQPVDRRTDVYSLGLVAYECLTGRRAFDGDTEHALKARILTEMPTPVRRLDPGIGTDLAVVVEKAIAKDPRDRYASAADLAEDLRRIRQREPILARRTGPVLRTWRWGQRNPLLAALLVVLTAGVSTSTWLLWRSEQALARLKEQEEVTRRESITAGFRQAELYAQRGSWREALRTYDTLDSLVGAPDPRIAIGRIGAWERTDQVARAVAAAEELVRRDDLGPHRAKALLLHAELTANRLTRPDQNTTELVEARASGDLSPSDVHFVDALLADTVEQSISHLQQAVATDPWNRRGVEMLGNLALVCGRTALAKEVIGKRQVLGIDDPTRFVFEVFVHGLAGEPERARRVVAQAPPVVRGQLAGWLPLLEQSSSLARDFDRLQVEALADRDFNRFAIITAKVLPLIRKASEMLQAQRTTADGMVFRVTPALGRALRSLLQGAIRYAVTWDKLAYAETLEQAGEVFGDGMFLFGAGNMRMSAEDFTGAEQRFVRALARPSAVVSASTVRLYLLAARLSLVQQGGEPALQVRQRQAALATLDEMLANPIADQLVARCMFVAARQLAAAEPGTRKPGTREPGTADPDAAARATEIALRWRRSFPEDPEARLAVEQVRR